MQHPNQADQGAQPIVNQLNAIPLPIQDVEMAPEKIVPTIADVTLHNFEANTISLPVKSTLFDGLTNVYTPSHHNPLISEAVAPNVTEARVDVIVDNNPLSKTEVGLIRAAGLSLTKLEAARSNSAKKFDNLVEDAVSQTYKHTSVKINTNSRISEEDRQILLLQTKHKIAVTAIAKEWLNYTRLDTEFKEVYPKLLASLREGLLRIAPALQLGYTGGVFPPEDGAILLSCHQKSSAIYLELLSSMRNSTAQFIARTTKAALAKAKLDERKNKATASKLEKAEASREKFFKKVGATSAEERQTAIIDLLLDKSNQGNSMRRHPSTPKKESQNLANQPAKSQKQPSKPKTKKKSKSAKKTPTKKGEEGNKRKP